MDQGVNIRAKTIKLLEENRGNTPQHNTEFGSYFLDMTRKQTREKTDKFDFIKIVHQRTVSTE